jgi:hypothetical protein
MLNHAIREELIARNLAELVEIPKARTIDVVSCADQEQAVHLAATHPAALSHPIEVRPFENE